MTDAPQSTSPTAPEFAVTAERLTSLKSRLQAISIRHSQRRSSTDSVGNVSQISATPSMSSVGDPPSQRYSMASMESMLNSVSASTDDLEKLPVPEEPRTLCHCGFSINENDPTSCGICGGFLEPLEKLTSEKARLSAELLDLKRKVRLMEQRQDASTHEMAILRDRCTELEEITAAKEAELSSVRADLDRLGQRLVDEVEVRAELQYSKDAMKDAMQEELEELTRSLFEEANSLVATEARHRYEHQQKEAGLRMQMEEMTLQLQMERDQLKELRARMETIEAERSLRGSANDVGGSLPRLNIHGSDDSMNTNSSSSPAPTYEDAIDPVLFAEFDEFVTAKSDIKLGKMHTLPFMKNALEDDVSPCLRFGGNPRTSTRRLIDAIIANTCFVEEISPAQQANMEAARQGRPTEASRTASPRASISPSRTASTNAQHNRSGGVLTEYESVTPTAKTAQPSNNVFNRSVMERLSNAFGGGSMTLSSSHQSLSSLANSCSACGRSPTAASSSTSTSTPSRGGQSTSTRFQFKTSDSPEEGWNPICQQCRDRLVAVCEFYNFARHVRQGLYSTRRREDLYMEVLSYKRRMFYARIGCARFAETDRTFSSRRPRPNSSVISPITGSIAMLEEPPALPPSASISPPATPLKASNTSLHDGAGLVLPSPVANHPVACEDSDDKTPTVSVAGQHPNSSLQDTDQANASEAPSDA